MRVYHLSCNLLGTSFDIIKIEGVGKASREKGKGEESGGRVEGDHCG